jgi:8-oxo-dGTP diphosphatase
MSKKTPIIGVGAIVEHNGSILLVKRGKEPHKGEWAIPGGKVEWGEPLHNAVIREIKEETGVEIEPGDLAYHFEHISETNGHHFIVLDFFARYVNGDLIAGDDADDVGWFIFKSLKQLNVNETTYQALRKLYPDRL